MDYLGVNYVNCCVSMDMCPFHMRPASSVFDNVFACVYFAILINLKFYSYTDLQKQEPTF
jgi:hypothetical protein